MLGWVGNFASKNLYDPKKFWSQNLGSKCSNLTNAAHCALGAPGAPGAPLLICSFSHFLLACSFSPEYAGVYQLARSLAQTSYVCVHWPAFSLIQIQFTM